MDQNAIARRLVQARKHAGLSQIKLAHLMSTSQSSIASRENGVRLPLLETLRDYAIRLDISAVWLVTGVGDISDYYEIRDNVIKLSLDMPWSDVASLDTPSLAARIMLVRGAVGMAQHQVASLAKMHRNSVTQYEQGTATPGVDRIPALAWAVNCNPLWLATGVSQPF